MKWQTGVVMETKGQHAVLLTPEGTFKKVRLKGRKPDIGEEIRIPVERRLSFHVQKASWLAVAAAIIVLMVASPLLKMINSPPEAAYAYVSIDINPSMELTVSNYYNVMAAQAYNSDGEKVLKGLDLEGKSIQNAVSTINNKAKQLGYIGDSKDNTIVLSYAFIPGAPAGKSPDGGMTLMALANEGIAEYKASSNVQTIKVPAEIRETAKKKGISPAKYAVLIEAVNSGLPVTEKDMKENSIKVAIASAGGEPEKIINQAHQEESFDLKEQRYFAILSERARTGGEDNKDPESPGTSVASKDGSQGTDNGSTKPNRPVEQSEKPVVTLTGRGNNNDGTSSSGDVKDPAGTPASGSGTGGSGNQAGVAAGGDNQGLPTTNPDGIGNVDPNDTSTEDNYMGSESSNRTSGDKSKMNVTKPNF